MSVYTTSPITYAVPIGPSALGPDTIQAPAGQVVEGIQVLNNSALTLLFYRGTTIGGTPFQVVYPGQQSMFNAGSSSVSIAYTGTAGYVGQLDIYFGPNQLSALTTVSTPPTAVEAVTIGGGGNFTLTGGVAGNQRNIGGANIVAGQSLWIVSLKITGLDFQRLLWEMYAGAGTAFGTVNACPSFRGNLDIEFPDPYPIFQCTGGPTNNGGSVIVGISAQENYVSPLNFQFWASAFVQ